MKIDFSQKIVVPGADEKQELTLGMVARGALNQGGRGGEPLKFDDAMKRGNLALKVGEGGEHEITPEEATLIRSLLPGLWAPMTVAIAAKMLDG